MLATRPPHLMTESRIQVNGSERVNDASTVDTTEWELVGGRLEMRKDKSIESVGLGSSGDCAIRI
jgi:hypothetical protein